MKPIIVHIGHPKTGSSAIQHHLKINHQRLAEFGYSYPVPKALLLAKSKVSSGNGDLFLRFDKPAEPVIFSNELLYAATNFQEGAEFHQKLMAYRDHIRIVIFTRDVFSHFLSAWGQGVKRGGRTETTDEFAQRYFNFNHLLLVVRFLEAQGIEFVLRNHSRMDDAVDSFMRLVLGDQADAYLAGAEFEKSVVNRSLTLAETELQRRLNEQFGMSPAGWIADQFVDLLPDVPSERQPLMQQTIDRVLKVNGPAVEVLNGYLPDGEEIRTDTPVGDPDGDDPKHAEFRFSAEQLDVIARFCFSLGDQNGKEK